MGGCAPDCSTSSPAGQGPPTRVGSTPGPNSSEPGSSTPRWTHSTGTPTRSATAWRTRIAVLDAFHVVKRGTQVVDEVRRRVQQDTLGHRGYKDDPLYKIRRR